jgi:hypothetical protein
MTPYGAGARGTGGVKGGDMGGLVGGVGWMEAVGGDMGLMLGGGGPLGGENEGG